MLWIKGHSHNAGMGMDREGLCWGEDIIWRKAEAMGHQNQHLAMQSHELCKRFLTTTQTAVLGPQCPHRNRTSNFRSAEEVE